MQAKTRLPGSLQGSGAWADSAGMHRDGSRRFASRVASGMASRLAPASLYRASRQALGLGLVCLSCTSCGLLGSSPRISREQALAAPDAAFAEQAIVVQVEASPELNALQGQAHTLVLGVLQAARSDTLSALGSQPEQVEQTLVAGREAPGVLQITRFVIQPGQRCIARVDRVRGALAVALAAGYAQPGSGRAPRVFGVGLELRSSGWIRRSYAASARPLYLALRLGPTGVLAAEPMAGPATPAAAASAPGSAAAPACQPLADTWEAVEEPGR